MGSFRPLLLVGLALRLCLGSAHAQSPVEDTLATEVASLEAALAASPEDLDIRLKLAYRLSWQSKTSAAREHARAVVEAAPTYWDAHLLLARLDAWAGHHEAANQRIDLVLSSNAKNQAALLLKADVGLWSKHYGDAEDAIWALLAMDVSADLYFRLAQIAFLREDFGGAREFVAKALELEPDHVRARALRADTTILKLYAISQAEVYPAIAGEGGIAYAQTLVLSIIPMSSLGVAITYDFHRRFGSDNHRVGGRVNWRASKTFILSAFFRGGKSPVLPDWSADLGVVYMPIREVSLGAKYNWDKMPWPGMLHRGTAHVSSQVTDDVLLQAEYFGGVMRHCQDSDYVQGASLKSRYQMGRLGLGLRYGFGSEVERAPLPASLQGRLDEDFCLGNLDPSTGGAALDLAETRAHALSADAALRVTDSTILEAGYGLQLRLDDTKVHLFQIAVQQAL